MTEATRQQTLAEMIAAADHTKSPSEAIMQQVLEEQGKEKLVVFAWRCSLRALPFLVGNHELTSIWQTETVRHCFAVIRTNVLMQKGLNASYLSGFDLSNVSYAKKAKTAAVRSDAAAYAVAAVATSACVGKNKQVTQTLLNAIESTRVALLSVDNLIVDQFNKVIWRDLEQITKCSSTDFFKTSLWLQQQKVFFLQQQLSSELTALGLGFTVPDIQALWRGELLAEKRLEFYSQDFSDEILNDPKALERLSSGETRAADNPAVRVLLLGPGGAGKTSLAEMLLTGKPPQRKAMTVEIAQQQMDLANHQAYLPDIDPEQLTLYLWDFGGQTIFHSLHKGFMRFENCVYVLVVDSRHEQSPDEWLQQLRQHLRDENVQMKHHKPTVFLVTNEYENVTRHQNKTRLLRQYPELLTVESFINLSCIKPDKAFTDFVEKLVKASTESQHVIENSTVEAMAILEDLYHDTFVLNRRKIIAELQQQVVGLDNDTGRTVRHLKNLGKLITFGEAGNLCLKPDWIVQEAYQLIYHPILRAKGGLINVDMAMELVSEQGRTWISDLISYLMEHHICQKYGKQYFFPDAAREDESPRVTQLLKPDYAQQTLTLHYDFLSLPLGFRATLICRLLAESSTISFDLKNGAIWRDGFVARFDNYRCEAVGLFDIEKRRITLHVIGDDMDGKAKAIVFFQQAMTEPFKGQAIVPLIDADLGGLKKNDPEFAVLTSQLEHYKFFVELGKKMASKQTQNVHIAGGNYVEANNGNVSADHYDNAGTNNGSVYQGGQGNRNEQADKKEDKTMRAAYVTGLFALLAAIVSGVLVAYFSG